MAPHPRGSILSLRVTPRSSSNRLERQGDGSILARVAAPPVDGAANAALIRLLADQLGLARSALTIDAGASGRHKRIVVTGVSAAELEQRLSSAAPPR